MMKPLLTFATVLSVAFATLGFHGCDKADQAYDCQGICQKYADCIDSNYDVSECADSCRTKAEDDQAFADRADDCQACVDDKACSETWPCVDECVGLVP
jgi:hypothetical protein